MRSWLAVAAAALAAGACAPKPVLYPNAHYKEVGKDRSQADMKECEALADQYVKNRAAANAAASTGKGAAIGAAGGAAAGAVFGGLGRGAAAGGAAGAAMGLVRGVFHASQPSPARRGFIERCLRERGYDVVGWQ